MVADLNSDNDLSGFASNYPEHPRGQEYLWCLAESPARGLFAGRAARAALLRRVLFAHFTGVFDEVVPVVWTIRGLR